LSLAGRWGTEKGDPGICSGYRLPPVLAWRHHGFARRATQRNAGATSRSQSGRRFAGVHLVEIALQIRIRFITPSGATPSALPPPPATQEPPTPATPPIQSAASRAPARYRPAGTPHRGAPSRPARDPPPAPSAHRSHCPSRHHVRRHAVQPDGRQHKPKRTEQRCQCRNHLFPLKVRAQDLAIFGRATAMSLPDTRTAMAPITLPVAQLPHLVAQSRLKTQ